MSDHFNAGAKCVCSAKEWYNAFGDKVTILVQGQRLTVKDRLRIGGALFLAFHEIEDEKTYFQSTGFTPMRSLN